jgi:outer membrane protein TolC
MAPPPRTVPRPPADGKDRRSAIAENPAATNHPVPGDAKLLTLEQALRLTGQVNPTVEAAWARVQRARSGEQVVFADFLPSATARFRHVDGGPDTYTFPTQPPAGTVGVMTFSDRTHEHDQTELYLQWLVCDFGRRWGRYDQATLSREIAELQFERAAQTASFNVAVAYYGMLRGQALRRVAQQAVRRAESDLRDARNLLRKGAAVRNDVLRAEAFLAEAQLQLVAAERAVGVARATLNEAIGLNVSSPTEVQERQYEPAFALPLAGALELAVGRRPEFASLLRSIRSARAGEKVAGADFLPRIYASSSANYSEDHPGSHELYNIGVNFEWNLFEGGRRVGHLRGAEADLRAALAEGRAICNRIALDVHTAWLGVDETHQRIRLARTALTQAGENLRLIRNLFRGGDALATEVVDAELAYVRAEQGDATALYDYQEALARLAYAAGIPVEEIESLGGPTCAPADADEGHSP